VGRQRCNTRSVFVFVPPVCSPFYSFLGAARLVPRLTASAVLNCTTTARIPDLLAAMSPSYPDFDDLPPVEGQPKGFAWGVFDNDGKKDILGTLNFITPDAVKAAAGEVKDGISVSLK
jgi:hypothetical protein